MPRKNNINWKEVWLRWRVGIVAAFLPAFFVLNWGWQSVRKPSEVIGLLEAGYFKDPRKTWETFSSLFQENSTPVISAELLAALAQAESRGNPIARTYWRWKWSLNPFALYAPASSAVGLLQITDGTFAEASRYCIHDHRVARVGSWHDINSCWFNSFYNRLMPSHAIEMTAAYLTVNVMNLSGTRPLSAATLQDLVAISHLCGPGVAAVYLKNGFRFAKTAYCDAHNPREYLKHVRQLTETFRKF